MKNNEVRFIRKNGRIIPIRLTDGQKKQAQGVAIAASGVVVSAAGGRVYRKAVVASSSMAFKAFRKLESAFASMGPAQMSFGDIARRAKMQRNADKLFKASKKIAGASKVARGVSAIAGAGLIGYGAMKAISGMSDDRRKKISPELAAGSSAALAFVVPQAYQYSKKAFEAGMMSKQTSMKFSSQYGPTIRKFASKLVFRK